MAYFYTEVQRKASGSTCYLEFQRGQYKDKCWLSDSLNLHDDIFNNLSLHLLFVQALPNFDHWGLTKVSKPQWKKLKQMAHITGGEVEKVIVELTPWADECFRSESCFTICGI
jgi:hypothetical protein